MTDTTTEARSAERARWKQLRAATRRSYWYQIALDVLLTVAAAVALVHWLVVDDWWWLPFASVALAAVVAYDAAVMIILRRSGMQLVQRRKMFVAFSFLGALAFDLGVAVTLIAGRWVGDDAHTHWLMPWVGVGFLVGAALDGHAAWAWRKSLPSLRRPRVHAGRAG